MFRVGHAACANSGSRGDSVAVAFFRHSVLPQLRACGGATQFATKRNTPQKLKKTPSSTKNIKKNFAESKILLTFASQKQITDSVAQLVEQMTLNHWVESSSLSGVTIKNGKSPQSTEIT